MAASAGKGGKGEKHKCPPIPSGWERKLTGPEAPKVSDEAQCAQLAQGKGHRVTTPCWNPETQRFEEREFLVTQAWIDGRIAWAGWLRELANLCRPMPRQQHGMRRVIV